MAGRRAAGLLRSIVSFARKTCAVTTRRGRNSCCDATKGRPAIENDGRVGQERRKACETNRYRPRSPTRPGRIVGVPTKEPERKSTKGRDEMRLMKTIGVAALTLALAAGTASAATVKIGVVLPFSGANADLGHQMDKAFDLYVKLHAQDIAPHKVELVKRDEGPPTGAAAKTGGTELITNDKVNLLLGFSFSPSAIALAPVMTQAKVPMVISNAGTAWITNLSPYIVRLSFSMWHHAFPMGPYAYNKIGCKTAALVYTAFPPGMVFSLIHICRCCRSRCGTTRSRWAPTPITRSAARPQRSPTPTSRRARTPPTPSRRASRRRAAKSSTPSRWAHQNKNQTTHQTTKKTKTHNQTTKTSSFRPARMRPA